MLNAVFNYKTNYPNGWRKHRVDSVIESSLWEITGSNNFALINLSLNFCETTIQDNKVVAYATPIHANINHWHYRCSVVD